MRKRYEKYKDSGIEWIGEVPEYWEIQRLRFLCDIGTGNKDTQDSVLEGKYPFFVRANTIERINEYMYDEEAVMTAGDGVGVGRVFHYYNGKFCAHQRLYVFKKFRKCKGKFIYYYLKVNLAYEVLKSNAKSTVDSLRRPMMINFPVSVPSIPEQEQIIDFLDQKTSEIDSLIADKEKLIQRLQEYRQSVITETVTKGLNPDVKMKDSGIDWIGEVPEHWKIVKLNFLKKKPFLYGANETPDDYNPDLPRYIRITDINNDGKLREDTERSLSWEKARHYLLEEGDILFARSGATVGKTFIYKDDAHKACFAGYLIKYSSNEKIMIPQFVYYFTLSSCYNFWVVFNTIQATIQNVSAEKYGNLSIPVPSIKEQISIVEHLNSKLTNVNDLIRAIQLEIAKINEYRQSLIFEAVTGKFKVN